MKLLERVLVNACTVVELQDLLLQIDPSQGNAWRTKHHTEKMWSSFKHAAEFCKLHFIFMHRWRRPHGPRRPTFFLGEPGLPTFKFRILPK